MPQRPRRGTPAPPPRATHRTLWVTLLAVVVFLGVLISRLPARWVLAAAGRDIRCASVAGSLWDGYCGGATVGGTPLGDLTWQLHPSQLLRGRLAAHVAAREANASARADVTLGLGGALAARNVVLDLPLDSTLVSAVPPYISGTAHANLERIEVTRQGVIKEIEGRISVHDLVDSSGEVTPLGSFVVTFPGGPGTPVGHLRDLGGPLSVDGTLRLTDQPGYDLRAMVAARADAVPSLTNALQYLGSADAEGRRPFALSGTY